MAIVGGAWIDGIFQAMFACVSLQVYQAIAHAASSRVLMSPLCE